ncbi:hemolysin family protein [Rubellicoccus peritrichatus]|uniref:Hemolysin family protein n=1 Tax=Rubellicoccus peritrichatus TaxID=3080537 RepID=A0AAQ3L9T1_9BACT|nr:hemolysin family protein [Puniceicoccus sp. CR14]WOO41736.1 hemolysin family protein [Puniceicoccus sp. CR14]
MTALIIAVLFTLGVSAFCSLLEAMILSTSTTDIEGLKKSHSKRGIMLERFREDIEETSSAILGLNTVANTAGASVSGALAIHSFGQENMILFSTFLVLAILILSEVIPKNIGVLYRAQLLPWMIYPLHAVRTIMLPISFLCSKIVLLVAGKRQTDEVSDQEIILLAEKGEKEGNISKDESSIISGALSLDEVRVEDLMTPRTVVLAFQKDATIGEVFAEHSNIPFARLPVFNENMDDIVGMVRRRDLLKAKAEDRDQITVDELKRGIIFVPEQTSVANALKQFLKEHQQLAAVVDEFGSVVGVVTMEDVIEQIIGQEIWETDDPAVDMREFARQKQLEEQASTAKQKIASSIKQSIHPEPQGGA